MIYKNICIGALLTLFLSTSLVAQNDRSFQLANRLMQQQAYGEALPLLEELHQQYPETYVIADRLIDCLIQLKQYDRGLEVAQSYYRHPEFSSQAKIRTGELYHLNSETEKAFETWNNNLRENSTQLQLYIETARTMISRREYIEAVEVYKKARTTFQNKRLFFGDIANAYMQAGEYELAINEWLSLLEDSPNQMSFIQRSLLRFNDPLLYDITIAEINERLRNISVSDIKYQTYYRLQIWLLQENKLFRRALAAAKEYENRTESYNYSLFNLGRQLVENNEFELAREAFTYYTDRTYGEVKWRGLEELAYTYSSWAKYIDDYNLDFTNQQDSLYRLSSAMLDSIETETNNYSGIKNVQLKRAELALDHIFNLEKAEEALQKLKKIPGALDSPELPYLEGRIHLSKHEFTSARINFTRANKKVQSGDLAEKTRYFLALTDFYSGDYEFAAIQLKSLGRQNTSYYANDALELRLWLQQGLAEDSAGTQLDKFAEAFFKAQNGQTYESAGLFLNLIEDPQFRALKDDAMLFLVESPNIEKATKLAKLSSFLLNNIHTPLKEKLLWEQAKLAEQKGFRSFRKNCDTISDCRFYSDSEISEADLNVTAREIYEEIILSYPQGFYAPYARERLTKLSNETS